MSRLTRAPCAPPAQEPAGREILTKWQIPAGRFSGSPRASAYGKSIELYPAQVHTAEAENTDLKLRSKVPCFQVID